MFARSVENKVVLITGSSKGIGKQTAQRLCEMGAKVMLNGRNEEKLKRTYQEFKDRGHDVDYRSADVTNEVECRQLIDHTVASFGQIDALINNGSATMEDYAEDLHPETFRQVLVSNSWGAALPTLMALPHLKESNGSVIFISSLAGFLGVPGASAYSMGKMSLTALAQSLRIELALTNVHVGVCHVSFTQNDEDKMVLDADGSMKKVAARPAFLQQSQQRVAQSIINMIRYRQRRKTLSGFGKTVGMLMRNFPLSMERIMRVSQKNKLKKRARN